MQEELIDFSSPGESVVLDFHSLQLEQARQQSQDAAD